ncbi:MAG TPA: NtaA/DmoA family FMN-dependent monooxygenase [Stellaceae bacterium]|jgi:FMN-dependent oxidoreductase (nitrilotriacetate monooxygenase family)|nr:NtaA/DmoA family FMN-dependent monooxygenase [Stellaceae bacterium]
MPKRMHLAFDLSYIHMEGRWRMPGAWPGRYPDVAMFEEIARIAEHGLLDMLFSGDGTGVPSTWAKSRDAAVRWGVSWPRQDLSPMSVAMSRVTKHLGFGITYSTTFTHPYFLARHFNSLDHVTGGRIAFNVITSTRRSDYANYGYDDLVAHDERYDRMEEFIDVCRALWSSVEPDAMLWDEDTGQVGDPGKVHDVEHRGRFFKVSGPLNTPPSPQTRPVLLQAGSSPRGVRACAYVADMAFGPDMPLSLQIAQRKALDEAVAALGRDPEGMGIIWQQPCVVAETEHEAVTRRELLLSAIPVEGVGVYLSHNGGYDFSTLPQRFTLGELHREIIASQASPGGFMREMVTRFGADTEITRGEFFDYGRRFATSYTRTIAGTPAQVADHLEEVFEATGSRGGFMLGHVVSMPHDLEAIVNLLVPELQRRGRFRREYKGSTLRENLFDD